MPTKTFFNLDEEKRKIIFDAAIKEFSRVGFDTSSIKNIVEEAKIPRGSFYQYFKDKEDLYLYVMCTLGREKRKGFEKILKENNGDIFISFEIVFKQEYKTYMKYHNLYKNFFSHSKYSMREKINKMKYFKNEDPQPSFRSLINTDSFAIKDDDSMKMLVRTLFSTLHHMIVHGDNHELDEEIVFEKYKKLLNMFKYGVLKRDENINS